MTSILYLALLQAAAVPPPAAAASDVTAPVVVTAHRDALTRMHCIVTVDGRLKDCTIISEDPPGRGYGAATLKVARLFKVKAAVRDGVPVESTITIPIRWKYDGAPPKDPSSVPTPSEPPQ